MDGIYHNKAKQRLKNGEKLICCWEQLGSTIATEILADSGYDMILFDCEHAPIEIASLVGHFQAMRGSNAMSMVRAPWNDLVMIKRILDSGAQGIHIPYVSTYEEAVNAVRACKYPPQGVRGIAGATRANYYGDNSHQYRERANDEVLVMIAVETPGAVDELDKMLTIDGLDGIFIGPMDLATSMGYFCKPSAPEVQAKIAEIEEKVLPSGKLLATVGATPDAAAALLKKGYSYVVMGSDQRYIRASAAADLKKLYEKMSDTNVL